MSKLNVLFVVNGEGLGNINRSLFICDFLAQHNYSVTIATSGQAYEKIKLLDRYKLLKIQSIAYAQSKNGQISFIKTFFYVFSWFKILIQNSKKLNSLYMSSDKIIIDSEYTIVLLKIFSKSKAVVISINNAANILQINNWKYFKLKLLASLGVEIFDYIFNILFVDRVLIPTLPGQTEFQGKFRSIPTFTRFTAYNYERKKSSNKKNIFIIPSSSKFQYGWEFLSTATINKNHQYYTIGFKVQGQPNFIELPKDFNLAEFAYSIDLIITRGGLTTLSEAVTLQTPTLVLPFQNHFEQIVNAFDAQRLGYGVILDPKKFSECLTQALNLTVHKCIDNKRITRMLSSAILYSK